MLSFAATICSIIVLSSGCQSGGGFKAGSFKPDFGALAFWKKDNVQLASKSVPPPSEHFRPDQGESTKQVAARNQNELKQSVEAIIAEAKRNKDKPKDPAYRPYSLDSIENKIGDASKSSNDFVQQNNTLQNLQKSATTAITSTKDTIRQANDIARNSGSALKGVTTNLQQQSQHAASQIAAGVSDGITKQATNIVSGATHAANNLLNSTSTGIQQTVNTVQEKLDNSFQPKNSATSDVRRNPYLGAVNNSANPSASTAAAPKTATGGATEKSADSLSAKLSQLAQGTRGSVGSMSGTQAKTPSFDSKIRTASAALQPLNNKASKTATTTTPGNVTRPAAYPSTPFGTIQPVRQASATENSSSQLPAELLNLKGSFAPGSTKPLQPLR